MPGVPNAMRFGGIRAGALRLSQSSAWTRFAGVVAWASAAPPPAALEEPIPTGVDAAEYTAFRGFDDEACPACRWDASRTA